VKVDRDWAINATVEGSLRVPLKTSITACCSSGLNSPAAGIAGRVVQL
jgi:hypothetical protein